MRTIYLVFIVRCVYMVILMVYHVGVTKTVGEKPSCIDPIFGLSLCMCVCVLSSVCVWSSFDSLLDDLDVHIVVSVISYGHTKVHGYSVVFTRLQNRHACSWGQWDVHIDTIQLGGEEDTDVLVRGTSFFMFFSFLFISCSVFCMNLMHLMLLRNFPSVAKNIYWIQWQTVLDSVCYFILNEYMQGSAFYHYFFLLLRY